MDSTTTVGRARKNGRRLPLWKRIVWPVLGSKAGLVFPVGPVWRLVARIDWRIHPGLSLALPHSVLRFQPVLYRGETVALSDGTKIEKGMRIIDVHANSDRILELRKKNGLSSRGLVTLASQDLAAAAPSIKKQYGERYVAFYMHGPWRPYIKGTGFETFQLKETNWLEKIGRGAERFFAEGWLLLYRLDDQRTIRHDAGPIYDGWRKI